MDSVINKLYTTLAAGITASATSMTLTDGSSFPDPSGVGEYNLVIYNSTDYATAASDPESHYVRVTVKPSTHVCTIQQPSAGNSYNGEGSDNTAQDHDTGGKTYTVAMVFSKNYYDLIVTAINGKQATSDNLTSVSGLTYASAAFVKMTGANTFSLDTNTYLTSLSGAVLIDQSSPQTIGLTGSRLLKLWATDITCTNAIVGSITGNAGTVTNATLTTALTVNTGTLTLTADAGNDSVLTIGGGAVSVSGENTGDQTLPVKAIGTELDTGTDDAKFATAKALSDSLIYGYNATTVPSSSTPTPVGSYKENIYTLTALAAGATFAAPSGAPASVNSLLIRIKDNGTPRTLAFNAIYRVIGVELPTTTVAGKTIYLGCKYNSADSKWDVLAVGSEEA